MWNADSDTMLFGYSWPSVLVFGWFVHVEEIGRALYGAEHGSRRAEDGGELTEDASNTGGPLL